MRGRAGTLDHLSVPRACAKTSQKPCPRRRCRLRPSRRCGRSFEQGRPCALELLEHLADHYAPSHPSLFSRFGRFVISLRNRERTKTPISRTPGPAGGAGSRPIGPGRRDPRHAVPGLLRLAHTPRKNEAKPAIPGTRWRGSCRVRNHRPARQPPQLPSRRTPPPTSPTSLHSQPSTLNAQLFSGIRASGWFSCLLFLQR
jgi:hypothetical protein